MRNQLLLAASVLVVVAGTQAFASAAKPPASPPAPAPAATAAPAAPTAPAPPAPPAANPQVSTTPYDDWMLRCQTLPAGAEIPRACEVTQLIRANGQDAPIAQIAFGRLRKSDSLTLTILVPPNVSFPSVAKFGADAMDASPTELAWLKCLPAGCLALAAVTDAEMARWQALTGQGTVAWKDNAGREAKVPMSFKGLAQAMAALAKEP